MHFQHRAGWLRAMVLGANDGVISIASMLFGLAAAATDVSIILLAGISATLAGAFSMAAGEYVSVKAQEDSQDADLAMEKAALDEYPDEELAELAQIYESRGLEPGLASEVAAQLMQHDALSAHARDEIGISEEQRAQPVVAAGVSALSFLLGSSVPLLTVWLVGSADQATQITTLGLSTLFSLMVLGTVSARLGGALVSRAVLRIVFWGVLALASTGLVGFALGLSI